MAMVPAMATAMESDVVIVGGGPAGSSAAIRLAHAGLSVVIIDKAVFPRDKCCGDGLTTAALRQLEGLGFEPARVPSWRVVSETTWRSPSGHAIHLTVPEQDGWRIAVARRGELDAVILDMARQAGAKVLEGHALATVAVSDDEVAITTSQGELVSAPYVIGADGMWSPLRRACRRATRVTTARFTLFASTSPT